VHNLERIAVFPGGIAMKNKMLVVPGLILVLILVLALSIQPVFATGEKIVLTKTPISAIANGANWDITYEFTVKNDGDPDLSKSLTDIHVDEDFIHDAQVGSNIVNWGELILAVGSTSPAKTWTYTTKASDIDTDGLGNKTVTNIARVHSVSISGTGVKGTKDIWNDASCTVPLNGGGSNLPELPAGILLGAGLIGIGGFVLIKRRSKVTTA
jgi:hypothetical protein